MARKISKLSKFLVVCISIAPVVLLVLVPTTIWVMNNFYSTTKICTVQSVELVSDSSGTGGPTPTRSLYIQTSDCGKITITKMKSPQGVNDAELAEVLEESKGKKFEFVIKKFQLNFGTTTGSTGVTSLETVK